jgi:hypothetical protein
LNPSSQPEGPAASLFRVLDQADRYRQGIFNGLSRCLVPSHETSRRAIVHLADEQLLDVGMIRPRNLAPNLAVRIAETRECTKAFRVGELKDRTVQHLRLMVIGFTTSRLGSFKSDLRVRAVTEGLGSRPTASTECIGLSMRDGLAFLPCLGSALSICCDGLFGEGMSPVTLYGPFSEMVTLTLLFVALMDQLPYEQISWHGTVSNRQCKPC